MRKPIRTTNAFEVINTGFRCATKSHGQPHKITATEAGLGHQRLHKDPCPQVRATVARCGGYLDRLMSDDEADVRIACTEASEIEPVHLDRLAFDISPKVRAFVALSGHLLDQLVKDPDPAVVEAVAAVASPKLRETAEGRLRELRG